MTNFEEVYEFLKNNYGEKHMGVVDIDGSFLKPVTHTFPNGNSDELDTRYNVPKNKPSVSKKLVDETILKTEIYRMVKLAILKSQNNDYLAQTDVYYTAKNQVLEAQRTQVAYGLEKYPEPLNANTWTVDETIEHIISECMDKLHYLMMLRIKLEQELVDKSISKVDSAKPNVLMDDLEQYMESFSTNLWKVIEDIDSMIDDTINQLHYLVALRIKL